MRYDTEEKRERHREAQRKYRAKDHEAYLEYMRNYRAKNRIATRTWHGASIRRDRLKNPEKNRARRLVQYALESGKIVKPLGCTHCGEITRLEGHHADYTKPLDVLWLCYHCHRTADGRATTRRRDR